MGWLGNKLSNFMETIAGEPPVTFSYVPSIPIHEVPGIGEDLEPDACYLTLYLESLRLERARRFGTRFNGLAYSMVTLAREGEQNAGLTAVSKPEKLAELDDSGIGRVITVSKEMIAPTAYRGGAVSLELGLFSVRAGNVLSPILDYVVKVSDTAGVSSVNAAKPFIPLLVDGMDLIAGAGKDTVLEVGLDTDLNLSKSCVSAIIARKKGTIDADQLELKADGTLLHKSKPLDCGYTTFSIRRALQKADYGEIPELRERYTQLIAEIQGGNKKDARDALTAFRLAVITSPDLIIDDVKRLISKATSKFDAAFSPTASVGLHSADTKAKEPSLYDLKLYD